MLLKQIFQLFKLWKSIAAALADVAPMATIVVRCQTRQWAPDGIMPSVLAEHRYLAVQVIGLKCLCGK